MSRIDLIQLRRDYAAAWSVANPLLDDGEPGYELDTGKIKIGDGATYWVDLPYNFDGTLTLADVEAAVGFTFGTLAARSSVQALDISDSSANARSLITAVNYAAMRALLDLEVGTDFLSPAAIAAAYQPLDGELTAIAGLTSAADSAPYFTGSGTAALMTVTAAARTVLDDVSVGAMLTTLGGQPLDAELTAIAGLTSAADRLPYFTGLGTAALATFTAAGRALVDDADATAQRATLGLVIGTNVQAFDAELAAIAGLTSAADSAPYFTGSGTAALMTVTAAARTVLDDVSVGAMLTTLGGQPLDAELTAIAGLTSAADRLPYFTGLGTAALATFTAFGRTLVDDADAATAQATLGLVIGTNVQAFDADLSALAANATNGIWARTGAGTGAARTLASASAGLTWTNGDGVAGNPTPVFANDLGALEALSGTNTIYYRSGVDTWTAVTIGGLLSFSAGTLNVGDAELAAIAGLVSAADSAPYFTGSGTAALMTVTAAARTVLDDTTVGAMLTTLGGQPLDADLTSWAGVTRAAGFDTFAATPSSANLAALVTGETGSGALVFGTSPGFTTAANPVSNDGASLGISGTAWSDLFLASGAVVNFNNGDVTITHSANALAFGGASSGYSFDAAIAALTGTAIPAGGTTGAGLTMSSTANLGVFFGSGAPTLSAARGSLYLRSDGMPCINDTGSTGWHEIAPTKNIKLSGVNFNSGSTDTSFSFVFPAGYTRARLNNMTITGASGTLTTATFALFTGAGGTGGALVANPTACTVSTGANDTAGNMQVVSASAFCTTASTLYFRVLTPQGVAATADVTMIWQFMP